MTRKAISCYVAAFLVENDDIDYRAKVFADRLILRVFNSPALVAYLRNMVVLDSREDGVEPGNYKFQLKFSRLPDEVIPQVKQLIGVADIRAVKFEEDHTSCTGFEFELSQHELDASNAAEPKMAVAPPQGNVAQSAE